MRLLRVLFAEFRMSCGLNDIFIPRQEKKTCTSNTRRKKEMSHLRAKRETARCANCVGDTTHQEAPSVSRSKRSVQNLSDIRNERPRNKKGRDDGKGQRVIVHSLLKYHSSSRFDRRPLSTKFSVLVWHEGTCCAETRVTAAVRRL